MIVQICVEDNGIGISKNILNNLFKLDVHNSQKGTANEEGSGLGLILCREIVEKHGGTIWVESVIGTGSKFFFTLTQINKMIFLIYNFQINILTSVCSVSRNLQL